MEVQDRTGDSGTRSAAALASGTPERPVFEQQMAQQPAEDQEDLLTLTRDRPSGADALGIDLGDWVNEEAWDNESAQPHNPEAVRHDRSVDGGSLGRSHKRARLLSPIWDEFSDIDYQSPTDPPAWGLNRPLQRDTTVESESGREGEGEERDARRSSDAMDEEHGPSDYQEEQPEEDQGGEPTWLSEDGVRNEAEASRIPEDQEEQEVLRGESVAWSPEEQMNLVEEVRELAMRQIRNAAAGREGPASAGATLRSDTDPPAARSAFVDAMAAKLFNEYLVSGGVLPRPPPRASAGPSHLSDKFARLQRSPSTPSPSERSHAASMLPTKPRVDTPYGARTRTTTRTYADRPRKGPGTGREEQEIPEMENDDRQRYDLVDRMEVDPPSAQEKSAAPPKHVAVTSKTTKKPPPKKPGVLRAEYLSETGRLRVTPRPVDGFPEVETLGPGDRTRHTMERALKHWRSEPTNTKLLAEVFAIERYDLKTATETARRLGRTIAIISDEEEPSVQTPQEKPDDVPALHAPTATLITDLSPRARSLLLDQGTWSTKDITFTVYERERENPTFLLALEGFTQDRPDAVARIVRETLEANPAFSNIENIVLKNPKLMARNPDTVALAMSFIKSLHVKMRRLADDDDTSLLVTYVYMRSPAYTTKEWEVWRESLFDHDFTGRNGRQVKVLPFPED
ncbi:hypothetical protein PYCCODRAFT_1469110 [Trametes coccinea BRFM310]|uniref:Uncharacterized protein n=1 Tax=Trametes coccinea (strain BRFM310) TaxID=1353009 RepID=A0A1Y2IIF3_TRAC3|nr:hypothetical protein PYCCODRAFT_1469110 [Trametes coccinea BRFM310]